jgi:predicted Holliday junction resolvase-like endonuclease
MSRRDKAKEMIRTLEDGRFYCECPECGETLRLRDAGLFYLDDFTPEAAERCRLMKEAVKERRKQLAEARKRIPQSAQRGAEAVNIGFILERIAPAMKAFRFDRNDCRSLFDPIDYVIFEGLSRRGAVEHIVFADIKTGQARLKRNQKEIRDLVESKRVEWQTYPAEDSK